MELKEYFFKIKMRTKKNSTTNSIKKMENQPINHDQDIQESQYIQESQDIQDPQEVNEVKEVKEVKEVNEVNTEIIEPKKNKRGRPKKNMSADQKVQKQPTLTTTSEESKKRGRPRKHNLSKQEYNLKYHEEHKERCIENATKNQTKYRDSYKLLKEMYFRRLLDDLEEPYFRRIEDILNIFSKA